MLRPLLGLTASRMRSNYKYGNVVSIRNATCEARTCQSTRRPSAARIGHRKTDEPMIQAGIDSGDESRPQRRLIEGTWQQEANPGPRHSLSLQLRKTSDTIL